MNDLGKFSDNHAVLKSDFDALENDYFEDRITKVEYWNAKALLRQSEAGFHQAAAIFKVADQLNSMRDFFINGRFTVNNR
jgi:hypothetical protein